MIFLERGIRREGVKKAERERERGTREEAKNALHSEPLPNKKGDGRRSSHQQRQTFSLKLSRLLYRELMRIILRRIISESTRMPKSSSKSAGVRASSTTTARSSSTVDISTPLRERPIQSLWADYGTISELELEVEGAEEEGEKKRKETTTVIVKRVKPPRGDSGDIGHQRKLDSYVCEAAFYQHCARRTIEGGAAIAEPLLISTSESSDEKKSFSLTLVLSDLRPTHPYFARGGLKPEQLQASLRWLARFHAVWWGCRGENESDNKNNDDDYPILPKELADREGTFWHLDTRPEEWAAIPGDGGGFLSNLKREAKGIADELKAEAKEFSTLNHGDAKAANFCWSSSPTSAAAYDFQYVGRGVGARDVAYLLSSAGSSCDEQLESSLDFYFGRLQEDLRSLGKISEAEKYTREILMYHFRLSTADFVRFMAGWGTWGGGAARAEGIAREVVEERRRKT